MSFLAKLASGHPVILPPAYAAPFDALGYLLDERDDALSFSNTLNPHDPIFSGHYPHFAIFPGVLIYEAFSQAIRYYCEKQGNDNAQGGRDSVQRVSRIKTLRFLKSLHPGDSYTVTIRRVQTHLDGSTEFLAKCESGNAQVATASLLARPDFTPAPAEFPSIESQSTYLPSAENLMQLQAVLPQRYPMLLVDRTLDLQAGRSVIAQKNISISEPCYRYCQTVRGADDLAYPSSLIIESFSQAVELLLSSVWDMESAKQDKIVAFGAFQDIVIYGSAYPGDSIVHRVELEYANATSAMFCGHSYVNGVPLLSYKRLIGVVLPKAESAGARL